MCFQLNAFQNGLLHILFGALKKNLCHVVGNMGNFITKIMSQGKGKKDTSHGHFSDGLFNLKQ